VDLTDFAGDKAYALYSTFTVGNEYTKYQLTVSGFNGTAGMFASHLIEPSLAKKVPHLIDKAGTCHNKNVT
jgi:hypothetical protein